MSLDRRAVLDAPPRAVPVDRARLRLPGLLGGAAVLLVLWFSPTHDAPAAQHAVAIAAALIVVWATEAVTHATAGLMGLALFWLSGAAPLGVVLSGFANESLLFLFGALVIGIMATTSGLAQRLASSLVVRAGGSYHGLLLAFIVTDFLLTFLIPSGMARVTILGAVAVGLVEALGLPPKGNVARGLLTIITYTAGIFDKMILAGAASILAHGIMEDVGGVYLSYTQWFIAFLPCDLITIVVCWRAILWLYPAPATLTGSGVYVAAELEKLGPWRPAQTRAALLMGLAVLLWMTDFLHGIRPATVACGVALLSLVPGLGVLRLTDLRAMRYGLLLFAASALSLTAVLDHSRGLEVLSHSLVAWLEPLTSSRIGASQALYWTAFGYHFFLGSEAAMLSATLGPVLRFAQDHGLPVLTTGLVWTFGSGAKVFAYQGNVLMVGYSFGQFEAKDLMKVGLLLTVVEALILLLLVPLYWPLIGLS